MITMIGTMITMCVKSSMKLAFISIIAFSQIAFAKSTMDVTTSIASKTKSLSWIGSIATQQATRVKDHRMMIIIVIMVLHLNQKIETAVIWLILTGIVL